MLSFDPEAHVYSVDGVVFPSVTQIVSRVIPRQHYADDWYLRRGSMVHKAVAMLLHGVLDMHSLDPRILGYVNAAAKAISENAGDFANDMEVEMARHHPVLRYAGTYDFLFLTNLWDWKTGDDPQTEIQLGGYVALIEPRRKVKSCSAIELHDDGTYSMKTYNPARCKALFMAALSIFGWLEANKINMKKGATE